MAHQHGPPPHQDTTQQEASDDSDPIEGDAADHGDGLLGHDEDETADEDASDMSERVVDDGSTVTASATRSTFAEGVTDSTSAPEPVAPSVASFREGMLEPTPTTAPDGSPTSPAPPTPPRDVYGRGARGRHLGRFEQPAHAVGAILLNVDDDLVAVVRTRRLELERRLALPPDPGAPT